MHVELDLSEVMLPVDGTGGAGGVVSIEDHKILQAVQRAKLKRLAMKGVNAKQAAKLVGLCKETVQAIYRDEGFKRDVLAAVNEAFDEVDDQFRMKQRTIHEEMEMLALDAFDKLKSYITEESNNITDYQRAKLCEGVLDRNLATSKVNRSMTLPTPQLQADTLARAAQVGEEMQQNLQRKLNRA